MNHVSSELTEEQKERIRLNKEAALARRLSGNTSKVDGGWVNVRKQPQLYTEVHGRKRQALEKENTLSLPVEPYYLPEVHSLQRTNLSHTAENRSAETKPSPSQMKVLKSVAMAQNVFLTGSAGTGKSFVLQFAVRQLRNMYGSDAVYVTASTGLAACSIGGTTIHSFAGIGLGTDNREVLLDKINSRRDSRIRWQSAKALIIDEISMVDADLFEKLDFIARKIRKKERPFGGIQLLVTGDFFQLPPVSGRNEVKKFAFEAPCWSSCFQLQIELGEVFRQSDSAFVSILNEIRKGQCSHETLEMLHKCKKDLISKDGVMMTRLYPHKIDVGRENEQNLVSLSEVELHFKALDSGKSEYTKKQLENTRAEKVLRLKKGAQVMLMKNLDPAIGLANGARGVVVGFCDPRDPGAAEFRRFVPDISPSGMWPVVRFAADQSERIIGPDSWAIEDGGVEVAKRSQVPLILAWALSVHKCQGMTLDRVETDLSRAFDFGMVYVALSRVRSLEGLNLKAFDPSKIKVHPKVGDFYKQLGDS